MRVTHYLLLVLLFELSPVAIATSANGSSGRCSDSAHADAIEVQRLAFNQAIEDADLETIATVIAEDVLLVTGTDSDRYSGKAAQLELWGSDFESDERLVYERTPECIQVSERFPIALERGRWRGEPTDGREGFVAGIYSAKWRHDGSVWRLEAEIFMTDECSASICPGAEKTK